MYDVFHVVLYVCVLYCIIQVQYDRVPHFFSPCSVQWRVYHVVFCAVSFVGRSGSHVPLGSCNISVDTMLNKAGSGSTFSLAGGTGEVVVHRCNLVPQPR